MKKKLLTARLTPEEELEFNSGGSPIVSADGLPNLVPVKINKYIYVIVRRDLPLVAGCNAVLMDDDRERHGRWWPAKGARRGTFAEYLDWRRSAETGNRAAVPRGSHCIRAVGVREST